MFSEIIFEKNNKIASITLNNPKNNNIVTEKKMILEIEEALNLINDDLSISVLLLKANGNVFSAGGDLKSMRDKSGMFSGGPNELFKNYIDNVQRIPKAFYNLKVPSIGVINGPASGAGCDLAFMCDMRVASQNAWFCQAFINVGLISGDGGLYFLQKIAKYPLMSEMIFTGNKISAQRAYDCGLVNKLTTNIDELELEALKMANQIASKPPAIIRLGLQLLKKTYGQELDDILYKSALTQVLCHNTKDHTEAVNAFLEKRKPKFQGN